MKVQVENAQQNEQVDWIKKTAVDFVIEKLEKLIPSGSQLEIMVIKEKADEMFEKQITDALEFGWSHMTHELKDYYTKTYSI